MLYFRKSLINSTLHKVLPGLRIGEVACLRWSDVTTTDGLVKDEIPYGQNINPSKFPDQRHRSSSHRSSTQRRQPQRPVNTTQAP